jgi:hypothetical protein
MDNGFLGGGNTDCFIKTSYLGHEIYTEIKTTHENEAYWLEQFLIPCQLPLATHNLKLEFLDKDFMTSEGIGTINIDIQSIFDQIPEFRWYHIYGPPKGTTGKWTSKMKQNPDLASAWRGRVQLKIEIGKDDNAELKMEDFELEDED